MDGDFFLGGHVEEEHSEDSGVAAHDFARGDLDVAPAADDDYAAKLIERGDVVGEVDVGEHFENHVGGDAVEVAGLAAVEDLVCALFADELEAAFGAGSANDAESGSAGELDGSNADAAAGAVDEDGFAPNGAGFLEEGPVGGGVGNIDSGALSEGKGAGKGMDLGWFAEGEFGIGAGKAPAEVNALAGGFDDAGSIHAGGVGEVWRRGVLAGADVGVNGVDAGSVDADEELPGCGMKVGDGFELHDVGRAELVDADGFHNGFIVA